MQVKADTPSALKDAGSEALKAEDLPRAAHMYTLGIDMVLEPALLSDKEAPDWFKLELQSKGILHALLSNRALVYTKQGDYEAAATDAEACCLAKPDFIKARVSLLFHECAGSKPQTTLAVTCARN